MKILNLGTMEIENWTAEDIVDYVNADRNPDWLDYDVTEWREAWYEWAEGEFYKIVESD
jgi:hypothetical protein